MRFLIPAATTAASFVGVHTLGALADAYETVGYGLHPMASALAALVLVCATFTAWAIALTDRT